MAEFVQRVLTWNKAAGRTDNEFNVRAVALHIGLQLEEMAEKLDALDVKHDSGLLSSGMDGIVLALNDYAEGFKRGDFDAAVDGADRTALLDADCDIMVVTVGAMMSSGADVQGALEEVCLSNESKSVPCELHPWREEIIDGEKFLNRFPPVKGCAVCEGRGWILTKDANGKIQNGADYFAPAIENFTHKDCGKVNSGHTCTMPKGSKCPDCSGIRGADIPQEV